MAEFLPGLVRLIDNALKSLSEWHVENDLSADVSCTSSEDVKREGKATMTSYCGYLSIVFQIVPVISYMDYVLLNANIEAIA